MSAAQNTSENIKYRVIMVCSGNTCRSPMAMVALRGRLPRDLKTAVEVISAGVDTISGLAPMVEAELAVRKHGYSLNDHQTRQVSEYLLETADLVLAMEEFQTAWIKRRFPLMADKIHTLRAYCGGPGGDIDDPFGHPLEFYYKTMDIIIGEIKRIMPCITRAAREKIKAGKPDTTPAAKSKKN